MPRFARRTSASSSSCSAADRATNFTTDRAAIIATIERFKKTHEQIEADLQQQFSGLQAVYGGTTPRPQVQQEIDAVFHPPGAAPHARTLPSATPTDSAQIADDRRRTIDDLQRADILATRNPTPFDTIDTFNASLTDMSFEEYASASVQTSQDLGNIYTGINYLKYVDGEKHLVFVTDAGLFLPRLENDYSIAALASAARVVLDTLQTGGLITMNPFNRDPVTGVNRGVNTASLARVSTDQLSSGHDLNIAASAERAPGTANLLVHVTLRDDRSRSRTRTGVTRPQSRSRTSRARQTRRWWARTGRSSISI